MRKKLLFIICCLYGITCFSQGISLDYVGQINRNLYDVGETQSYPKSLDALQASADREMPIA